MRKIELDGDSNTFSIIDGNDNCYLEVPINDIKLVKLKNFRLDLCLDKENRIVGIKLKNLFSKSELKGYKAEFLFKKVLEELDIPVLYIGQNPSGVSFSKTIKESLKSNRPDFLVNFPDVGNLFFDVKCRKKIGFVSKKDKYFYLSKEEMDALIELNDSMLIPVWIAFLDCETVEKDTTPTFYLSSVSLLKKYRDVLINELEEYENDMLCVYRIPGELQTEVRGRVLLEFGALPNIKKIVEKTRDYYKGLIRKIEDEIKILVRENTIYKTNISHKVTEKLDFVLRIEAEHILDRLIEKNTIIYEPYEPLKLLGEE